MGFCSVYARHMLLRPRQRHNNTRWHCQLKNRVGAGCFTKYTYVTPQRIVVVV